MWEEIQDIFMGATFSVLDIRTVPFGFYAVVSYFIL